MKQSKKKDHILDTTKKVDTYHKKLKKDYVGLKPVKVTRPNFRKYLRDKIDMKVRVNPELSEELQKIAGEEGIKTRGGDLLPKNTGCGIIRFYCCDHYSLVYYPGVVTFEKIEATEYNPETDTLVEKVEEPKPIKTVGIDNSDVTLVLTAQHEPTPLQIAKMIRDNRYQCLKVSNCKGCPLRLVRNCGNGSEFSTNEERELRRQLIDDYISANELVKDCPVNSEYPDPIRVDIPDIFYCPIPQGILRFKRSHIILKDTNNEDCLLKYRDEYPCYRTLEEALMVAKKLWSDK